MQWSPEQERALKAIDNWIKSKDKQTFALGGFAGVGKTTLAKHIANNHGGTVKYAAFTGKAASVLRAKGCPNATTIHRLIYLPKGRAGEGDILELQDFIEKESNNADRDEAKLATWRRELKKKTEDSSTMFERKDDKECDIMEADLVIIDESSMVDKRMGHDLESYGIPILYLGDPGQLPPVKGRPHLNPGDYDMVLTEIHRQAKDSPIIWLANEIRQGRGIQFGEHGDGLVKVLPKSKWDIEVLVGADQVITGMNKSRYAITRKMRKFIGFDKIYPLANDKLICCRNDHDKGLLNGVACKALREGTKKGNILFLDIQYAGAKMAGTLCDAGFFQANYEDRSHFAKGDGVQQFDYGYCITGHKSQGSQWRHVVIADDKMRVNDSDMRKKWLYTSITRAEEELTYYV